MKKYLATFTFKYDSDSIALHGFQVMTEKEMDVYNDIAESIIWDFTIEDSSDEKELYFSDGLELLSSLDFKEISNDEYKALLKVFEDGKFGTFISEESLQTIVSDEEESSIDEDDEEEDDNNDNDDDY